MELTAPRSPLLGVNLRQASRDRPVAVGGDLTPESILAAFASGMFPMPNAPGDPREIARILYEDEVEEQRIATIASHADPFSITWWCPDPRFVVPTSDIRINKKIRALIRRTGWRSTINVAFPEVIEACRADREPRWMTDEYVTAMHSLFAAGWAYSCEVWDGAELVGGGFGLICDQVLSMDSHFHRQPGASKLVMIDAAARAAESGLSVLDLQWPTDHGKDVGGIPLARGTYLDLLATRVKLAELDPQTRELSRLIADPPHHDGRSNTTTQSRLRPDQGDRQSR